MMPVRVLAFLDGEGYPLVVPMRSLQPGGVEAKQAAHQKATSASFQRSQQAAPLHHKPNRYADNMPTT